MQSKIDLTIRLQIPSYTVPAKSLAERSIVQGSDYQSQGHYSVESEVKICWLESIKEKERKGNTYTGIAQVSKFQPEC